MRRPLLILAMLTSACGSGGEERNEAGVTIALPPAVPAAAVTEPKPQPPKPPEAPAPESKKAPEPEPQPAEKAKAPEPEPKAAAPKSAEKAAPNRTLADADPPAAPKESTGARPPLSNELIASTIRRIGFPCESVSSTSAFRGDSQRPAGYRINCSAGETYLGTVTEGRMRFRKFDR